MAGLWPWGTGTIHLPPRRSMMFMPQRPYLPLGSLHAAVSYPAEPERFDDLAVGAALERVGLDHLVPSLDREQRWDKDLSLDEQQRLAFARLLLHQPRWVLLDDAMGALEEDHRRLMLSIFEHELADAAVISIGRSPAHDGFYSRILHFRRLSEGAAPVPLRPRRLAPPVRGVRGGGARSGLTAQSHPAERPGAAGSRRSAGDARRARVAPGGRAALRCAARSGSRPDRRRSQAPGTTRLWRLVASERDGAPARRRSGHPARAPLARNTAI